MPSGDPLTLMKLVFQNGGIHPIRIVRLILILLRLSLSYPSALLERFYFANQINEEIIGEAPVFIIGHYRSGTSLMHKLLTSDSRWRFINEYELVFPHHGVRMENFLKPILQRFITRFQLKHPNFNNYTISLDDPNEDEALLVSAGASWGSYWSFIFPLHAHEILVKTVDFENDNLKVLWKSSYLFFLKKLLWRKKGHLLIKSPPSTARIKTILELFPDAKFIYMYRNPEIVSKSMEKIWYKEILKYFSLQKPDESIIKQHVKYVQHLFINAFQRDKHLIPEGNLIEVCYENFLSDKFSTIENIYRQFHLSFDELTQKSVEEKVKLQIDYRESKYEA